MERKNRRHIITHKYAKVCNSLIIAFYVAGLIGLLIPKLAPVFIQLIPYHLLLMFALMVYPHIDKNRSFWTYLLVATVGGFIIEVMGVQTGEIFGDYSYGKALGFKIAEVPIMMGILWTILAYSTGIFVRQFELSNQIFESLIGAFILLCFDILFEPIAVKYDFWIWKGMDIPFRNYIAWFVVAFLMLRFFYAMDFKKVNPSAVVLLFTQLAFFIALNIWGF